MLGFRAKVAHSIELSTSCLQKRWPGIPVSEIFSGVARRYQTEFHSRNEVLHCVQVDEIRGDLVRPKIGGIRFWHKFLIDVRVVDVDPPLLGFVIDNPEKQGFYV